jgi:hypothetical protein
MHRLLLNDWHRSGAGGSASVVVPGVDGAPNPPGTAANLMMPTDRYCGTAISSPATPCGARRVVTGVLASVSASEGTATPDLRENRPGARSMVANRSPWRMQGARPMTTTTTRRGWLNRPSRCRRWEGRLGTWDFRPYLFEIPLGSLPVTVRAARRSTWSARHPGMTPFPPSHRWGPLDWAWLRGAKAEWGVHPSPSARGLGLDPVRRTGRFS